MTLRKPEESKESLEFFHDNDFEEPSGSNMVGHGSCSVVHKLRSIKDGRYYAVKIIHDDELRNVLLSEIKNLTKLSYPTILKYHGI